jgi:hypothetical protein
MDFQKMIDNLLPVLGQVGVDTLAEVFKDLAGDQDKPWKQAALALLGDAVAANGMAGIELARKAINDLFDKKVPEIDWASPRTASDIVAKLQNAEAGDKSAANDFFVKFGDSLSKILVTLVKGFVS